eukprot:scaffold50332_cov18-Tisochrysis_lutea.AAC.1
MGCTAAGESTDQHIIHTVADALGCRGRGAQSLGGSTPKGAPVELTLNDALLRVAMWGESSVGEVRGFVIQTLQPAISWREALACIGKPGLHACGAIPVPPGLHPFPPR